MVVDPSSDNTWNEKDSVSAASREDTGFFCFFSENSGIPPLGLQHPREIIIQNSLSVDQSTEEHLKDEFWKWQSCSSLLLCWTVVQNSTVSGLQFYTHSRNQVPIKCSHCYMYLCVLESLFRAWKGTPVVDSSRQIESEHFLSSH